MANGWQLAAGLLAAGAIGAVGLNAGAWLGDHRSTSSALTSQLAAEATKVVSSVNAGAGQTAVDEATAAAAAPQLRAALRNRVDAATIEDLFASEDWWLPYRGRAVAIVGPSGTLVSHPARQLAPDVDLATRARAEGALFTIKRSGDAAVLVGAVVVDGVAGSPALSLVRPIDASVIGEWSRAAGASLAITDGRRLILSSDDQIGRISLAGHEREASAAAGDGRQVAAPSALGDGLWLWVAHPAPTPTQGRPELWAVAVMMAIGAAVLFLFGRGKRQAARMDGARADGGRVDNARMDTERPRRITSNSAEFAAMPGALSPREAEVTDEGSGGTWPNARRSAGTYVSGAAPPSPAGKFGRYELLERIGEGGMSDIFTATMRGAQGFQRVLVVKRLKRELSQNRAAVEQFIDEARLGSLLSHPNIVQVYDFGEVDDGYFMALEYVAGRNVMQLVERHLRIYGVPLDLPTVFYLAHDVLQALGYAHGRTNANGEPLGIVHRDVSPGNIVISNLGDVKLIDFGIVKAEDRLSHSDLGNIKGNPAFMAPEQARGLPVDARSDLFSVGLVMYHALRGDMIYQGATSSETLYRAASGPAPFEIERILALPEPAARVLGRALAGDPEDRYQTAEEFAAAIAAEIRPGARATMSTLMQTLFGPELRSDGRPVSTSHDRRTPARPRAS